jgi:mannose-6-phosphate isomerase-like protein (cupin superfamily)
VIIESTDYTVVSKNANCDYFGRSGYPDWTDLNTFCDFPDQRIGSGVEPHYHDFDEFWLFYSGRGEVWLDEQRYEITPNTAVYIPMGAVHKSLMFTNYGNVSVVTRPERQQRAAHVWVEEGGPPPPAVTGALLDLPEGIEPAYEYGGPPVPTVPGFVVAGASNTGPFVNRGSRCPLSELRMVALAPGESVGAGRPASNEHWLVVEGSIELHVEGREIVLAPGDLALLRAGTAGRLRSVEGARAGLAREPVG